MAAMTETAKQFFDACETDRIRHMTKIWNDAFSLKLLGWM
jgi:hypothetical protein